MPRQITSFSNETVKRLRALRDKKARKSEGLFLAEGLRILAEARDSGRLPDIIAYSAAGGVHPLAAEIIAEAEAKGADVIETSPDILSKMSGKDNPQAILGAYRQPDTTLEAIDRSASPLWIVAQSLRDPGNIGTILRTGDATGAGGLILIDNVLQGGRVVDEDATDESVTVIRGLNDALVVDERVRVVLLPIGDGVSVVQKV